MSSPKTMTIRVEQLCVGLYVHLDIPWLDHSFARNSFKISGNEQISAIRKMGLATIRIEPARCECRPLAENAEPPSGVIEEQQPSADELEMILAKKERIQKLMDERAAIAACEKEYLKATTALKSISRNLFSRPQDACRDANQLIQQMLDALLADKNIAIHLMNDKIAGEDAYYHALNVAVLAMMLAKEMSLPAELIKFLGVGCLFHDIGKIEIPDRIVNKSFPLTRSEQNLMQQHCMYGETIGHKIRLDKTVIDIILQHHEYVDGSGYPQQLHSEQISPLAKIVAIINTYDNHCNRPDPADSLSPYEALSYMFSVQRKLFDPTALNIFIRCMGIYPPGTLVKLSDGTLGMVVSVNSGKPLLPSILIYDQNIPKDEAIILDLSAEPGLEIASSLKQTQLSSDVYDYLSPRKRMNYFFDTPKNNPGKV